MCDPGDDFDRYGDMLLSVTSASVFSITKVSSVKLYSVPSNLEPIKMTVWNSLVQINYP